MFNPHGFAFTGILPQIHIKVYHLKYIIKEKWKPQSYKIILVPVSYWCEI